MTKTMTFFFDRDKKCTTTTATTFEEEEEEVFRVLIKRACSIYNVRKAFPLSGLVRVSFYLFKVKNLGFETKMFRVSKEREREGESPFFFFDFFGTFFHHFWSPLLVV